MRAMVPWVLAFAPLATMAQPSQVPSKDVTSLLQQEVSILDALDQTIFEIRRAEMDLQNALAAQARLEARQEAANQALAAAQDRAAETLSRLRVTLRLVAVSDPPDILRVLIGGDEEETRRAALFKRLAVRQAQEYKAYAEAVKAARVLEFLAAMERANAYAAAQAAREARTRLEAEARARREVLKAIERDRALAMRVAREVGQAHSDLVRIVRARLSGASGPVDFERLKGRLRLPLAGARIAIPFGDVVHPYFKTIVPHPGVTLAFPRGEDRNVRAVAFGKVVFLGRMRGYGTTVVLDHASGYYTVYGGLARVEVQEGAIVREGDILGRVHRIPGEEDLRLYFEIRRGHEALNPAPYLATSTGR